MPPSYPNHARPIQSVNAVVGDNFASSDPVSSRCHTPLSDRTDPLLRRPARTRPNRLRLPRFVRPDMAWEGGWVRNRGVPSRVKTIDVLRAKPPNCARGVAVRRYGFAGLVWNRLTTINMSPVNQGHDFPISNPGVSGISGSHDSMQSLEGENDPYEVGFSESIQAVVGADPDISFAILKMARTKSSLNPSLAVNDSIAVLNSLIRPRSSAGAGLRRSPSPTVVIHSAPSLSRRIAWEPTWISVSSGSCRLSDRGMGRTDLVVSAIHSFPLAACPICITWPTRIPVR